jgi:hypothetical protein
MADDKAKRIPGKKQGQKARKKIVPSQDIDTAILRDAKEELTND